MCWHLRTVRAWPASQPCTQTCHCRSKGGMYPAVGEWEPTPTGRCLKLAKVLGGAQAICACVGNKFTTPAARLVLTSLLFFSGSTSFPLSVSCQLSGPLHCSQSQTVSRLDDTRQGSFSRLSNTSEALFCIVGLHITQSRHLAMLASEPPTCPFLEPRDHYSEEFTSCSGLPRCFLFRSSPHKRNKGRNNSLKSRRRLCNIYNGLRYFLSEMRPSITHCFIGASSLYYRQSSQ